MSEIEPAAGAAAPSMPEGADLVPGWLERLAAVGWRLLATVALALALTWIALELSTVTASILIAAIVAATFAPFVLTLRNRGWSRVKAAAAVFVGAALVILATLIVVAFAFLPYISQALDSLSAGMAALQAQLAGIDIPPQIGAAIDRVTQGIQAWFSTEVSQIAGAIGTVATVGILATFLTFFFMMDGDKAWVWAMSSTQPWRRDAITTAGDDALARVGGYLRGTTVIAAFDAVVEGMFLVILGVPLVLPLSVIVFFGRFIPYIGGLITTIMLLIVTVGTAGTTAAFILLILIAILNVIQGKFLAPIIYQKTVHIHPALALIALPAGAALAGIVGLFVAIPVVAFTLAVVNAVISILGVEPSARPTWESLVPIWLDRLGQWSWRLLVALGLLAFFIALAVQVPIVVMPLVLGIILAATLGPLRERLQRRGWSRGRAAMGATLGVALGTLLIVALTIVSLAGSANEAIDQAIAGADSTNDGLGGNAGPLVSLVQTFGAGILQTIAGGLSGLASVGVVFLLATLLTFYFLRDGSGFWQSFLTRVEPARRSHVGAAGQRAVNVLGGYMIGTGAISAFGAATQFLIMTVLGLPLALPLAVLAFFGGFIPYIGSLITTGLAFLVTVATGTPQDVAIMAIYTVVFNIVQGNIVAPLVYSRVVSLHPAVVLAAIPAGNEIAGIVGMFLVVPFLGVIAAVWRTLLLVMDTGPIDALTPPEPVPDAVASETALPVSATD